MCVCVHACVPLMVRVCFPRVLECQGLPIVNGQCDPYAAVSLLGPSRSALSDWLSRALLSRPSNLFHRCIIFYVPPLLCCSQVGCKEDQGETENQQSSVWGGFLFWGISIFFFFLWFFKNCLFYYCWFKDLSCFLFLSAFPCNSPVDKVLKDSGSFLKFPNPLAHPGIIHSCPKIIALS